MYICFTSFITIILLKHKSNLNKTSSISQIQLWEAKKEDSLLWNLQETSFIKMCCNITKRTHLKFITAWNTCYCWSCGLSFTPMLVIFTENYAIKNSQTIMKPNAAYHCILLFVYNFYNLLLNIWQFQFTN